VKLTALNTAIVLDSTADFPDASDRFVNWRVVPLYVNFGTDSFKDGVELTAREFYERLRNSPELPTTSQPTPGDFLAVYEELGAYERILSIHIASKLSGTFQSAGTAAEMLGDGRVRTIDSESASVAIAMLALAIQRRLERGTTDEEIDALVERYLVEHGLLFTVDTLEFLARGGRIGRAKAFAGRSSTYRANPGARCFPSRYFPNRRRKARTAPPWRQWPRRPAVRARSFLPTARWAATGESADPGFHSASGRRKALFL